MAIVIIRPNGAKDSGNWMQFGQFRWDNVVNYPTLAGMTDSAQAHGFIALDDNKLEGCTLQDVPNVDVVTTVAIYSLGQTRNSGRYMEMSYSINNGSSWSGEYDCTGHKVSTTDQDGTWHYNVFSGLSWSQAQINNMCIRFRADVPSGSKTIGDINYLYVAYVVVTYTALPPGPSIAKINDVSLSSIAKINDVLKANVAKMNDVG